MERLRNGSDRGNIHTRRRVLSAICRPYVVESDDNAKGIAGSCMLVLMIVKPRDFKESIWVKRIIAEGQVL